jgi:uncharacterized protein (DUF3084 family)
MTMLVTSHPEVEGAVKEYRRLTVFEEIRRFMDDVNDAWRVRKGRDAYVREEGYNKAAAEYQGQLSAKDEQLSAKDEQLSAKDERIRQDQERIRQDQERIRELEEENRRLRGGLKSEELGGRS